MKELKEDVFLTGFIWKPELRPLSKKEVISGKPKAKAKPAAPAANKPKDSAVKKDSPVIKDNPVKTAAPPAKPGATPLKKQ
jgi:hypothetical protein